MSLPRLSPRPFFYCLAACFGAFCVLLGALWFITGHATLLPAFPKVPAEAFASLAGGLAVVLWAVARLRRELTSPRPRR